MIVCLCKGVTDRAVRRCAQQGATSLEEVSRRTGAGTGCGSCHSLVRVILAEEAQMTMEKEEQIAAK